MTIRRQPQTLFTSAARTATIVSSVLSAEEVISSIFTIDCTAVTSTPSVVFSIEGKDPLSGTFYNIIDSAAITATGTTTIQIGMNIIAAANIAANEMLPSEYRITATHGDGDSITYTVGAVHMVQN
ncbi:MAG: hypothetical protein COA94_05070 [Rickettsiales bacterium]|nr:MAG: hypothetical protein COA94_05070 [Rickettsiales bacterium]